MTHHTNGPWIAHSGSVWKPDGSADGFPIAHMDRETGSTIPTERDANARLIAAAPYLLGCLREQTRLLDEYLSGALVVFPSAIRHQSREAIAQAEGRAAE